MCIAITKKGKKCKRVSTGDFCFQHKPSKGDCSICLEKEHLKKLTCCGNVIGNKCYKKWNQKDGATCPFCRSKKEFNKRTPYPCRFLITRPPIINGRVILLFRYNRIFIQRISDTQESELNSVR